MDIHSGFWLIDDECTTPTAGDMGFVYISSSGVLSTENNQLVFLYPPYSEVNGWDDTPEEISGTQVIECKLDILESYPFSDEKINYLVSRWVIPKHAIKYQASIIAVTPFLQFCKDYSGADKFGFFYSDQEMIWKKSKKHYKNNFKDGITYLSGSVPEQQFSTLIEIKDDRLFVKFYEHYDPIEEIHVVVNQELRGEELRFFWKLLTD